MICHLLSLYSSRASLSIGPTDLEFINLLKLKEIGAGDVFIKDNGMLCYVNEQLFRNILPSTSTIVFQANKDQESCGK